MKLWPGYSYIGPIRAVREEDKEDGHHLAHIQSKNYSMVLRLTNDGLFKAIDAPIAPTQPLHTKWGTQQENLAPEFTRCAKLFGTSLKLAQEEVNTPFILDLIMQKCRGVTKADFAKAEQCHRQIFHVSDYNQDKMLDEGELARAYRQLAFMNSATMRLCDQMQNYGTKTHDDARTFAAQIFDATKDPESGKKKASLSYEDIVALITAREHHQGFIYTAIEYARGLQGLMPFMPNPDQSQSCAPSYPNALQTLGTIESAPITQGPETNAQKTEP